MPALKKIGAAALSAFGFTSGTSGITSQVLVIAGGGAGGAAAGVVTGAGGGAGGVSYHSGKSLDVNTTYTVVIGAGAAGGATGATQGPSGSNSSFDTIISIGGGGGGAGYAATQALANGVTGGSGGGGGSTTVTSVGYGAVSIQGSSGGATGYGNAGGNGLHNAGVNAAGGGGGGAGAAGANATSANYYGGVGGVGLSTWSSWGAATSTGENVSGTYYYAGGGGGAGGIFGNNAAGGYGGGAYGGYGGDATQAPNAQANTGGGGGGGPVYTGAGGSGLVIVRYQGTQQFVGGVVTTDGTYIYHTFTTSGSLVPITTPITANFLVVAGGAGGGGTTGGGGGAGGFRTSAGTSGGGGSAESALSLSLSTSYTVIVGAGGASALGEVYGGNGSNSSVGSLITSVGGGGGANNTGRNGASGGSGGGGAQSNGGGNTSGGSGTANQGYAGGGGFSGTYPNTCSGGGGGAGAVGQTVTSGTTGGSGGTGVASSISGSSVTYAGGGGGWGGTVSGSGGSGGGGAGSNQSSTPVGGSGSANTGGGGGGGPNSGSVSGGQGGSGIVIISYAGSQLFGGGVVTTAAGNTIHTFYTSGTLSPISTLLAQYLIVAGGGGAGGAGAGGGGAGGLLAGSNATIDTNSTYLVTVGAGGVGVSTGVATNGSNSVFSIVSTTAVGGGGGASWNLTPALSGGNGGSGGGAGTTDTAGSTGSRGQGVGGQGYAGGLSYGGPATGGSGGGGGAGQIGFTGATNVAGNGGNGISSSISGTATYYAGGGGGATSAGGTTQGVGGLGGGGTGSKTSNGSAGTVNLGGGGGGGGYNGTVWTGGNGGSGIVIIAYPGSTQRMAGGAVTIVSNTVVHTFTSSGYLTPLTYFGNSLRFRSSVTGYLSRTFAAAGDRQKWTWSGWIKRGALGSRQGWYSVGPTSGRTDTNVLQFGWQNTDVFQVGVETQYVLQSTQVFRDPAAWYHFVVAFDSTQASASNRLRIYVNGSEITAWGTDSRGTYITQNASLGVNLSANPEFIGTITAALSPTDGYMSNINFVDGQQLTPNAFGSYNSYGVWQPVTYGGSYGTNGFFLPFNAGAQSYAASFSGSSQYLSIAQNTALNLAGGDWTIECWFNWNGSTADYRTLFAKRAAGAATPASYQVFLYTGTGVLYFYNGTTSTSTGVVPTANKWNHLACVQNGSNVIIYLNGVSIATIANTTTDVNTPFYIGYSGTAAEAFTGYISNFRIVKGTAVYTTNFTPSTTPLTAISGTSLLTLQNSTIVDNSTNALTITNTGSVTTAPDLPLSTGIFNDQSPQGNNWTPNNISGIPGATLDYMVDVPTLSNATSANYCVLNPLNTQSSLSVTNGNLQVTNSTSNWRSSIGTMGASSGKWYWEVIPTGPTYVFTGFAKSSYSGLTDNQYVGSTADSYGYYANGGGVYNNGAATSYGNSYTTGDVVGVALDLDNGKAYFSVNGTWQNSGDPVAQTNPAFTGLSGTFLPGIGIYGALGITINFGQQPFKYTPPTGYVALNTYNM